MFLSAVKVGVVLAVAAGQGLPLDRKEQAAWNRIRPSIALILRSGSPSGTAAMIDSEGFFVADRSAVATKEVDARLLDGRTIRLSLRSTDPTTQLALLKIVGGVPEGMRTLSAPGGGLRSGKPLFAIVPSGPVRAELVSDNQFGRFEPSLRVLPMSEIRFESTSGTIGGALLVSYDGQFMGALSATLPRKEDDDLAMALAAPKVSKIAGGVRTIPRLEGIGPAVMTVAYSVGPEVVQHVLEGFLSSSHEVSYPTLGVFCQDAVGGGALIKNVVPGSGAEQAGLRPGDVILGIGDATIRTQIDFSRVMFYQKVGGTTKIRYRRGAMQYILDVPIGKQGD